MDKIKDIQQGDVITFISSDNKYKALLCTSTHKDKSPQNYTFAALTYSSHKKPVVDDLIASEFYGVGNTKNDYFKYSESEIEKIWRIHPEIKPYFMGSYGFIIWRKDFMKFRDNFEIIGNLNIVDNLDKNGNGGTNASDWDFLKDLFTDKLKNKLNERGQNTFKVISIIR